MDAVGGGQLQQALQKIVEAERQPIKALQGRKQVEDTKIKLFGEFKAKFTAMQKALDDMSNVRRLKELKAELGDGTNLMEVTLDKDKAQEGTYELEIKSLAQRGAMISNGFSSPDKAVLGVGWIKAYLPEGDPYEFFVDEDISSLHGIANTINSVEKAPIRAAVIKDATDSEKPWKLILSSKADGYDKGVQFPEIYFLGGDEDISMSEDREAKNAAISIDGFDIELESNEMGDFLPGVAAKLKSAKPGQPFTLSITQDTKKISAKVKGLIDTINPILEFITKQNQVDEKTDTRTMFSGDTSITNIEYRLRNLVHEGFPSGNPGDPDFKIINLHQIGIEFTKAGNLKFDEDKFNKSLQDNYDAISNSLSGEMGFVNQLRQVMANFTRPGNGILAMREQGLRSRMKQLDSSIAQKEGLLEKKVASLTAQYARMQSTISGMQRQQQYMASALGGGGGGGDIVSQLLGG